MTDKFCKIYAAGSNIGSKEELLLSFGQHFDIPRISISFLGNEQFDIGFSENDQFDGIKQKGFPDGFLYFPYLIDIDFNADVNLEFCVTIISKILNWFWKEKNTPAVAACDYEDLLPFNGGYANPDVPW